MEVHADMFIGILCVRLLPTLLSWALRSPVQLLTPVPLLSISNSWGSWHGDWGGGPRLAFLSPGFHHLALPSSALRQPPMTAPPPAINNHSSTLLFFCLHKPSSFTSFSLFSSTFQTPLLSDPVGMSSTLLPWAVLMSKLTWRASGIRLTWGVSQLRSKALYSK